MMRRFVLVGLVGLLFAAIAPAGLTAQAPEKSAPSQVAPAAEPQLATPRVPQQSYSLPPDKLAKAIAISRIRNILNIAGSVWSIVFAGLLLATRAWAGLERWAQRISDWRWIQGAVFFVAYLIAGALGRSSSCFGAMY